jgi:hypothetical protein
MMRKNIIRIQYMSVSRREFVKQMENVRQKLIAHSPKLTINQRLGLLMAIPPNRARRLKHLPTNKELIYLVHAPRTPPSRRTNHVMPKYRWSKLKTYPNGSTNIYHNSRVGRIVVHLKPHQRLENYWRIHKKFPAPVLPMNALSQAFRKLTVSRTSPPRTNASRKA